MSLFNLGKEKDDDFATAKNEERIEQMNKHLQGTTELNEEELESLAGGLYITDPIERIITRKRNQGRYSIAGKPN